MNTPEFKPAGDICVGDIWKPEEICFAIIDAENVGEKSIRFTIKGPNSVIQKITFRRRTLVRIIRIIL